MTASASDLERLTLSVNGLQFDALAIGPTGGELVLCLHGFPEFADAWTPIMQMLALSGYRVVAVNQRGYSPRARPAQVNDYAIRELVDDVFGFASQLGVQQFHLVGHDWGGIVAWAAAAAYPEQLHSLCVVSTPHLDALRRALATNWDQKRRSWYVALLRLPTPIPERMLLALNARGLRSAYKRKVPRDHVAANVQRLREPGALTAALNWYRALNFRMKIGTISVPTLFIWGSEDQALGRKAAETTREFITAPYQFEPLEGASHWLLGEHPSLIAGFLAGHLRRFSGQLHASRGPQRDGTEPGNDKD